MLAEPFASSPFEALAELLRWPCPAAALPALVLLLVLSRHLGFWAVGPWAGENGLPWGSRLALAGLLTLLVVPLQTWPALRTVPTLADAVLLGLAEAIWGAALGGCVRLFFTAAQLAGQLIAGATGSLPVESAPDWFDDQNPPEAQLVTGVFLATFWATGGYRVVLSAIMDSWSAFPPGTATLTPEWLTLVCALGNHTALLALRAGAPVLLTGWLTSLVLALLARVIPWVQTVPWGPTVQVPLSWLVAGLTLGGLAATILPELARALLPLLQLGGP